MKKVKDYRVISVAAFSCLFAYLMSFAFEGKVLYGRLSQFGLRADTYIINAIIAHFAGLFSCGFFVKSMAKAKNIVVVAMVLCIIVTIPFFFNPSSLWLIGIVLAAFLSGIAVAAWGYFLKEYTPENQRIKSCADMLIYSNIIMIVINVIALSTSYRLGILLSLISVIIGLYFTSYLPSQITSTIEVKKEEKLTGHLKKSMIILFIFVSVITINSGLMYQVINPAFEHLTLLVSWYWAIPYIAALAGIRNLSIKANRSRFLYIGMAMIMAAFICFMIMKRGAIDYLLIDTLMLGACGIFDLFWWSILGEMLNYTENPVKVFGVGLSANVFGVLCGDIIGLAVTYVGLEPSMVTVIALSVVCVTLIILPPLNIQLLLLLKSHAYLTVYSNMDDEKKSTVINEAKLLSPLTEREKDVLQLILLGKSNKDIAQQLCISENTVKTHARNIFSKYEVASRTELISLILKNQA